MDKYHIIDSEYVECNIAGDTAMLQKRDGTMLMIYNVPYEKYEKIFQPFDINQLSEDELKPLEKEYYEKFKKTLKEADCPFAKIDKTYLSNLKKTNPIATVSSPNHRTI
ncbi:hypothetical protein A4S06_11700 [Erysipelotrichaceae bacterium MTC7]|nr:hypothetical protein A4S06_11700 [Erysipelotrichaceae bacterium MTC7]